MDERTAVIPGHSTLSENNGNFCVLTWDEDHVSYQMRKMNSQNSVYSNKQNFQNSGEISFVKNTWKDAQ